MYVTFSQYQTGGLLGRMVARIQRPAQMKALRLLGRKLKVKDKYTLHAAEQLIRDGDALARQQQIKSEYAMTIFNDEGQMRYNDVVVFGSGASFLGNIYLVVKNSLDTVLKDESASEKKRLLEELDRALNEESRMLLQEQNEVPHRKSRSVETEEKTPAADAPQAAPTEPISEPAPMERRFQRAEKQVKKARTVPKLPSLRLPRVRPVFLLVIAGLVLVSGVGYQVYAALNRDPVVPPYTTLMKEDKYLEAAKEYPDHRSSIEDELAAQGRTKVLATFQKRYPSKNGSFDLAFQQRSYAKVISASQAATMTKLRKAKLAVAYVKTKQYDEALVMNADLNDDNLAAQIAVGYIRTGNFDKAESVNRTLKNATITQAIKTGRQYQTAINYYDKVAADKKRSSSARLKAKNAADTFRHQLKTLGD